jgi:uncharacterized protein (TIGR00369 family)
MTPEEQQERVRSSFAKQGLMTTLGATLGSVSPGMVEIVLRPHPAISQQHGFVHGGAVSAIADSAAGYAALTLMPADTGVLTTEFKINLLAPAAGERIVARGRVVKSWPHPHFGPSGGVCEYRRTRKADRSAHCNPYGCQRA